MYDLNLHNFIIYLQYVIEQNRSKGFAAKSKFYNRNTLNKFLYNPSISQKPKKSLTRCNFSFLGSFTSALLNALFYTV